MMLHALVLLLGLAQAPPPAQDPARTCEIRGRVTDKDTGQPLPNAQVTIAERTLNLNRTISTDDAGAFRFTRLPPGQYDGFAHGGRLRVTHDFQGLKGSTPRFIELAKGDVREVNIALPRTSAIPVRVVDEFGAPLSELGISVFRAPEINRTAGPFFQRTDDRGRIRVFGLAPGRYVVAAPMTSGALAHQSQLDTHSKATP